MEQQLFKAGLEAHGKRWADVARFTGTRTDEQVHGYSAAALEGTTAEGTRAAAAAAAAMMTKGKKRARTTTGHGGKDNNGDNDNSSKAAKKPPAPAPAPVAAARRATTTTRKTMRGPKDGHWTEEEHQLFLECWHKYGKAWKTIANVMKTRSNEQIRTHAQKYFTKLEQLRHCGYEGDYTMDGTRHLTKAFVTKAQKAGRVGSGGYVNPLRAEKGRGNVITTIMATITASGPPRRCSTRTRKVPAPAPVPAATAKAAQVGAGDFDQEVPAPAPLPAPLPISIVPLNHDCLHAAAPASAMAALAEDPHANVASSNTATTGSESDEENDNDEALYGDMGSLLNFSDDDELPAEIVEGSILDFSAFMTSCHQEEGAEVGEGGGQGAGSSSTGSVTSSVAANAAVPGTLLIGADGPTHNEDVLAPLLDTSNGANSADCCDSSFAAWVIEDETTNESEARPSSAVGAVPYTEHHHHQQQQAHEHGQPPQVFFQMF